jgi:hypothetical protein
MNKFIVTTTINAPTEALIKYASFEDWTLIVVGDKKTPHQQYKDMLPHIIYLSPDEQESLYPEISNLLGWNVIQRRNIGFIHAYRQGAQVVATVDDDNIPKENWGVGINSIFSDGLDANIYECDGLIGCPLAITHEKKIWHRGYPVKDLEKRLNISLIGTQHKRVGVLASLWDGDPDVDAICRIALRPEVSFDIEYYYSYSNVLVPFNSQNTIIRRELLPYYFMFPHIGRMDDIWGGYFLQQQTAFFGQQVIFGPSTVIQRRNDHDLIKDLEAELLGYRLGSEDIAQGIHRFLPAKSLEAFECYQNYFNV